MKNYTHFSAQAQVELAGAEVERKGILFKKAGKNEEERIAGEKLIAPQSLAERVRTSLVKTTRDAASHPKPGWTTARRTLLENEEERIPIESSD
jgi:hypothetical protein